MPRFFPDMLSAVRYIKKFFIFSAGKDVFSMPPRKKRPSSETEKDVFATRLRKSMEDRKISKTQLGKAIGISVQAVSQYTTGQSKPGPEKLVILARFLNESTDYLLGLSESRSVDISTREICARTNLTDGAFAALSSLTHHENDSDDTATKKELAQLLVNEIMKEL